MDASRGIGVAKVELVTIQEGRRPQVAATGLDIAKSVLQVRAVDDQGRVVLRKRLARAKVLAFSAKLPPCVIGLEGVRRGAPPGARAAGAGPRRPADPAHDVEAYVETNRHDLADAEACPEAVRRPSLRFVPVKSAAQQAMARLHRMRDQLIGQREAQAAPR